MKKKSPPYAIIGAVVFGVILVLAYLAHEKQVQADMQAKIAAAQRDAQSRVDAEKSKKTTAVNVTEVEQGRPVLYATQPVEAGIRISNAFYEKKMTPKDILPDAYTASSDIVGWFAIRKIEKGDPLTPRNIGKSLPYMTQRISPGMRAISLPVYNTQNNNTGGFAVDGDRVDLLFTTLSGDGKFQYNTQTLMQNVPILYMPGTALKTDKTDGINPAGGPIAVTFEVTPEQAQALVFLSAAKDARISMILRARLDKTEVKVKPFDMENYDFLDMKKVQKTVDKSNDRVKALALEIEAKEKAQAAQGTTNETTTPTPPAP